MSRLDAVFEEGALVDKAALVEKGIIKSESTLVKLLGSGEISKKLTVQLDKASASAKNKIEAAGGTVETAC